jgi:hypothetical protein
MYVARLIIVYVLILVLLVACSPQVQSETRQAWVSMRPAVLEFMDVLYAAIRTFVAGAESNDGIDNQPSGPNYNFIVTMDWGGFL